MAFDGIEQRLKIVSQVCDNPRIVIAGGGNYSEKYHDLMIIKASGGFLCDVTKDKVVVVRRPIIREALEYHYDEDPTKREAQYKDFLMLSTIGGGKSRPSVETAVHELLSKYVLHTHATALTILSSVEETPQLIDKWLGPECLLMDYIDPGILLGIEANRLINQHGRMPDGIMQRNHGVFFASDDFDQLVENHNQAVSTIEQKIETMIKQKGLDKEPFGKAADDYEKRNEKAELQPMLWAIYNAVFPNPIEPLTYRTSHLDMVPIENFEVYKLSGEKGVIYFYMDGLAKAYVQSQMARDDALRLSWLTPDHLVSMGKHTDYIRISDPTNVSRTANEIADQIKPHENGLYARVYVIEGLGIATVGGYLPSDKEPEVKARYAMQFVNDALLVHQGVRAIGTLRRLTEKNVDFIANWEVEKARAQVFQDKG